MGRCCLLSSKYASRLGSYHQAGTVTGWKPPLVYPGLFTALQHMQTSRRKKKTRKLAFTMSSATRHQKNDRAFFSNSVTTIYLGTRQQFNPSGTPPPVSFVCQENHNNFKTHIHDVLGDSPDAVVHAWQTLLHHTRVQRPHTSIRRPVQQVPPTISSQQGF